MQISQFEWFVARRYLTARRKQAFISLISGVSILGVTVGVMALIVALAVMTGVQGELRDRIVGSTAHVYVYKIAGGGMTDIDAELKKMAIPGVVGAAPTLTGMGLMTSTQGRSAPVTIKGVDSTREPSVTDIDSATRSGSINALANRPENARGGVMIGTDLATTLGVTVGDSVRILTAEGTSIPGGGIIQKSQLLTVVGLFRFGFYEYDTAFALVSLDTAELLLKRLAPDQIQVRLAHMDDAPQFRERLQDQLGVGYQVQDWTQVNRALYSALWLEKVAISLTIGLIVMVAALNIVASLVLLVMEKSRDIAILRTMGAPARSIRRIFVFQGLTIGLTGTAAGTVLGLIVCRIADHYQLIKLSSEVYQIAYLPFRLETVDVVVVVVSAVVVCFLATIYPSRQAGRLDPAEALRNQ